MKKVMFWVSFPFLLILIIPIGIVGSVMVFLMEKLWDLCNYWEWFCLHKEEGWERLGGGLYKKDWEGASADRKGVSTDQEE